MVDANFVGDWTGFSGYSAHLRGLSRAFKKLNTRVSIECVLPDGWERGLSDEDYLLLGTPRLEQAWQVMITNPLIAQYKLADKNNGVLAFMVFEGDVAPKQWGLIAPKFSKVLCPSEHNKKALVAAGIKPEHIMVVPHGFDPQKFNPQVMPKPEWQSDKFTLVWNKGWNKGIHDRSGFHTVLQAFCEEFKKEEPVRLLAHINPAYNNQAWNAEEEVKKLNLPAERAQILINAQPMPVEDIAQWYKAGHVGLCVSRADAFNLPCLEMMACGLPIITNDFSGTTDYVPPNGNIFVGGKLEPVVITDHADLALYEQCSWQSLNIEELKKAMRYMFELWKNDFIKLKQIGDYNAKIALERWQWSNSASKLLTTINELENAKNS